MSQQKKAPVKSSPANTIDLRYIKEQRQYVTAEYWTNTPTSSNQKQ